MKFNSTKVNINKEQYVSNIALIIIIFVIFGILILLVPQFLNYGFFSELLKRSSELIILAVGVTIVFISGGFDLTFGSIMALSGIVCGTLYNTGLTFPISFLIGILSGLLASFINALLIIKLRFEPIIISLAMMQVVRSVIYGITGGKTVVGFPESFINMSEISVFGIPLIFLIAIFVAIICSLFLTKTVVGRYIYAMGGNERAASITGIRTDRIKYFVYLLNGFLASFGGLIFASRANSVPPNTGLNVPLEVITAVIIGGTLISGGVGSILGSFLGIFIMVLLLNSFNILGINPFWNLIFVGVIMILVIGRERLNTIFSKIIPRKKFLKLIRK